MDYPSSEPSMPMPPEDLMPPAPAMAAAVPPPAGKFPSFGSLLKRAFVIWKIQWWRLAVVSILPNLLAFALGAFGLAALIALGKLMSSGVAAIIILILVGLVALAILAWLAARLGAMVIQLALGADERVGLAEAWRRTKGKAWSFALVSFLVSVTVFGGLLLIVPGLIWSVAFVFAPFVLVRDGLKGRDALVRSRQLAKGDFGNLFISGLVFWLFCVLISAPFLVGQAAFHQGSAGRSVISVLGAIFGILVTGPLASGFLSAIFESLVARKSANLPGMPRAKLVYTIAAVFGLLWPLLLILPLFFASTLLRSAQMKAALNRDAATQGVGEIGIGASPIAPIGGANGDADNDGLKDDAEAGQGTDSQNPDSDGDGLADGDEMKIFNTIPTAANSYGSPYTDGENLKNGYDPLQDGERLTEERIAYFKSMMKYAPLHEPTLTTLKGSPILE